MLTEDLVVEYANDRFLRTFDVDADKTIGCRLASLGDGQWNIPALLDELGKILSGGDSFPASHIRALGEVLWFADRAAAGRWA